MSFENSNFTGIPNSFIDRFLKDLEYAEITTMLVIFRKTTGYHRRCAEISLSLFQEITGLSKQGAIDSCQNLEKKGFIKIHRFDGFTNQYEVVFRENKSDSYEKNGSDFDEMGSQLSRRGVVNSVDGGSQLSRRGVVNSVDPLKKRNKNIKKTTTGAAAPDPAVVVFSCLKDLEIPNWQKKKLSADFANDEAKCIELVRRFNAWKTKETPGKAISTLLKQWDTWDTTPSKEDQKKHIEDQKTSILESNKTWVKDIYQKIKNKLYDARIFIVDETRVQINNLKGGTWSLGYLDENLRPALIGFLQNMKIAI